MKGKKIIAVLSAVAMLGGTLAGLAACGGGPVVDVDANLLPASKDATYNTYTSQMPSNWNMLTSQDQADMAIQSYIHSSFFDDDFVFDEEKGGKFTADGRINNVAIVADAVRQDYSAATKVVDATAEYKETWGFTDKQVQDGGYAYKITLRNDLKWDDGTAIKAEDFVYSMKAQLDPAFKNYRANTFYDNIFLLNAKKYFYGDSDYNYVLVSSKGYKTNAAAIEADEPLYIDIVSFWDELAGLNVSGYVTKDNHAITQWLSVADNTVYDDPETWEMEKACDTAEKKAAVLTGVGLVYRENLDDGEGGTYNTWATGEDETAEDYDEYGETDEAFYDVVHAGAFSAEEVWTYYAGPGADFASYFEVGGELEDLVGIAVENTDKDFSFEKVGIKAVGDYDLVLGFEQPITNVLNKDGTLAFNSTYELSGFPLVKKSLYEECIIEPTAIGGLYTSNYCSSKETTASWGPYKLTEYQQGKSYRLEKNPYWYGWNLDLYKDQYHYNAVACEKITEVSTVWLKFLSGQVDNAGVDVTHKEDYRNSKYTHFTPGSATWSAIMFSDESVLNENGRNNCILAITEFRKAFSLAIDRNDYNSKLTTAHQTGLGLLNREYYYDVANNKRYRDSDIAKETLVLTYGCTKNDDGTYSNGGNIDHASLDDAIDMINGYDLAQAKALVDQAYDIMVANSEKYNYDPTKKIEILYGATTNDEITQLEIQYLNGVFQKMTEGTKLQGQIEFKFKETSDADWFDDFTANNYDYCGGGFSNAPYNPLVIINGYLDPASGYTPWWDTEKEMLTLTMPAGDYEGAGQTLTMSLKNWYRCATATTLDTDKYKYNWGAGVVDETVRLTVLAGLERAILTSYKIIPLTAQNSATILGQKITYITEDYNPFMGYGGMRYARFNYTDDEWAAYVASQNNDLSTEYKKTI